MLKKLLFTITTISALTIQAKANCHRDYSKLICPGDTVVSFNGFVGDVQGVNIFKREATVHWHTTSDGYRHDQRSTFEIEKLALAAGCIHEYCINDTVTSHNGFVGRIIGLNPYREEAAVHWHTTSDGYHHDKRSTFRVRELMIGRGCVLGYCVGDTVMSGNGFNGEILAVNYWSETATVHWHTTSDGYRHDKRSTFKITDLSNAAYCDDYGHHHRTAPYFLERSTEYLRAEQLDGFNTKYYLNK